jgi:hypothetical protein
MAINPIPGEAPAGRTEVAYFSAKTISLSRVNGRKPCTLGAAARHNLREIQAEIGAAGNIDAARIKHNIILEGPRTAAEVEDKAKVLMAGVERGKQRKDYVQAIEVVFQAPPSCSDPSAYLNRCKEWVKGAMGLPVLSAVIHRDESSPHAHVLLLPVKAGKYVGGSPIARDKLFQLRDEFFEKVAGPAGFQRYGAKLSGEMKRLGIAAVDEWLTVRGAHHACGPAWPLFRHHLERDPTQFVRALEIDLSKVEILTAKPIGIAETMKSGCEKPIGIAGDGLERRSLSLCRVRSLHSASDPLPLLQRADSDELIRVRDDHVHDVDHWTD